MIEAFGLTDAGCVRQNNEDYFLVLPELGLYLVADGMGGAQAGEKASSQAAQAVAEVIRGTEVRDSSVLNLAFHEANRRVRTLAASNRTMEGMGTTLTAVLDCGDRLEIANVGDSRCYRVANGAAEPLTVDQTWVKEVGSKLGLGEEKLRNHPYRHVLTMAIGASNSLKVNQYTVHVEPNVPLLLCSDGLHGVISEENIAEIASSEQSLEAQCHLLVEAARSAGGPDNITVVLLQAAPES
jgi:protein phosphatase